MRTQLAGVLTILALFGATTQPSIDEPARALAKEFGQRLAASRYMESGQGREVTLPGWEGFPTRRYTYSVKDADGTIKSADVIMLNASAEQIARWIVSAVIEARGRYDPADGKMVFKHILEQSGGQFPVAGVVYEDIIPADGVYEIYCFRDGVTVKIDGVPHRGTKPMTPAQTAASINGPVTRVFNYGRIASTSPEMWIAAGGSPDVMNAAEPTKAWMMEIRAAYQAAWKSDQNALLTAWVKAKLN